MGMILCQNKTVPQLITHSSSREKNNQFNNNKLESITEDKEITFDSWKEIIENASK